ncbi:MAG: ABC transporter permease [Anaerolineaceae bacterium]|nr:ABC transporter permease [Anaerolineaceae bacterium]
MIKEASSIITNQNNLSDKSKKKLETLYADVVAVRKMGKLENAIGPDYYRVFRGLFNTPSSIIGMVLLLLFILIAVFAPFIVPPRGGNRDPYNIPRDGFSSIPKPMMSEWKKQTPGTVPGWYKAVFKRDEWVHVMGTTSGGYDILYGIVWGTRTAFKSGITIVALTLSIGVIIGSIAAYFGGKVDNVIMRIVDVFMTLPFLLAALILAAVLIPRMGRSNVPAIIALTAFGWMGYARLIRGDILSVKERDYVLAARVIGVKDSKILMRHIIPNAIFPTLVIASMDIGGLVLSFAALSFLGVGAEVGYADWGQIISFARDWISTLSTYWFMVVFPGLALTLFVLAWNLIGDAVRDILDPRLRNSFE